MQIYPGKKFQFINSNFFPLENDLFLLFVDELENFLRKVIGFRNSEELYVGCSKCKKILILSPCVSNSVLLFNSLSFSGMKLCCKKNNSIVGQNKRFTKASIDIRHIKWLIDVTTQIIIEYDRRQCKNYQYHKNCQHLIRQTENMTLDWLIRKAIYFQFLFISIVFIYIHCVCFLYECYQTQITKRKRYQNKTK